MFKRNVVANYAGSIWISLLSVIIVPIYLRFIGVEAYGLISIFISFRATLSIFEMGLSTAVNREIAARLNLVDKEKKISEFIRTAEYISWTTGFFLFVIILITAIIYPDLFFGNKNLSIDIIRNCQIIFAFNILLSWPNGFYRGVFRGLEKQVQYNWIIITFSTLRSILIVVILFYFSTSVEVLMLVQALASALETFYLSKFSWNLLSIISQNEKSKKFSKLEAKKIVKNVANISLMSITGMIIANSDRLLIGYKLDLEQLGFYTIASTLAVALNRIIGPIIIAVFPRFTSIFSKLDLNHLRKMYFLLNRLTILLITPLAIFLVIVSQELMLIWTDDAKNTKVISIVFSYLVIAQIFNSMMQVSTNLLISIDKLKILNFLNLIIIIIYIPGFYYALPYFGLVNAALSWMLLNLFSYIVIEIYTCLEIFKLGVVQFVSYLFVERLSLIVNILFLLLCIIPVKWILTLSNLQYLLLSSIYLILLYCFFTKQILRIIKNLSD